MQLTELARSGRWRKTHEQTIQRPRATDLSNCPLSAQQAYNMLNLLDQSIKQNQQMLEKQDKICERLTRLERCLFAGRVVFWFITSVGLFAAWMMGFCMMPKVLRRISRIF